MTVPNLLSFVRLLLVPWFFILVIFDRDFLALILLAVSSVTDFVDGQIARRFNQVTRLGQLLDPAADRLIILAALIGLSISGVIPGWLAAITIGRDVLLVVLGITLANHGYGPLPVHHLGKFATFCLFFALPILMLGQAFHQLLPFTVPVGWGFFLWGIFLYWWAGALYAIETVRVVRIPLPKTAS